MTEKQLQQSEFLLYKSSDGEIKIDVFLQDETVWLTQKKMSDLFGVDVRTISEHLKNIYNSGELNEKSVIRKIRTTANDGKEYLINFYNLDAIISVGYRVNSARATQFRIWATKQLKEYIIKGFVMDDERLKNPNSPFGIDYFEQVLERIRDIRSSERRFYQKITDIYATSIDYDKGADLTQVFFATVQNKMHYGIHGKTAAEIIAERADSKNKNMGITCIPRNKLKRSDIFVAKNYLTEKELKELNLIVDQYLSYAELQANNKKAMTMKDWVHKLDDFLRFNEKEILTHKGKISKKLAETRAETEYQKFKAIEDKTFESDFDKETKKLLKNQ
ncbi:virulence RhuM family protein [Patescibacteria group bacterium]|nr:virulence RhuM family protein [Patescibacteria group bacterium]MBU1015706.1 virulence RhuM family protein [Patescibacteria group bacterium]MBU1685216.1 virulence RhuM family protein [Patescibacteria group bacterium]MBU1939059.1 virulence RhuM family protein [Patescibacteria group bacterium]